MSGSDAPGTILDLVSMGCRWTLDLTALPGGDAAAMAARWQRCVALAAGDPLVLDEDPVTVRAMITPTASTASTADERVVVAADPERLPYDLSREITRTGLGRLRGRVTLLHAAALADGSGRALVLVAPSGGGKSTATRVLGQRLGYVSDESVILLSDHRIAPHPKPPSLVIDPDDRMHKEERPPDELGLLPTPPSPTLAALVTLSRDPQAVTPALEPVGLIDQVLLVLPETSSTWLLPDGLHQLARAITAGGEPRRLHYAEIDACHDLLHEHLAQARPAPQTWQHVPPAKWQRLEDESTGERDVDGSGDPDPTCADLRAVDRVVRAPWSDAITVDGEVLVLAGSRPLRLAGAGAAIWSAATEPCTVEELTAHAVGALGENPDAPELVRQAVGELVDHDALRIVRG